jgi:hypothetical protein
VVEDSSPLAERFFNPAGKCPDGLHRQVVVHGAIVLIILDGARKNPISALR